MAAVAIAAGLSLIFPPDAVQGQALATSTLTPTATARPPVADVIGEELVDLFRMENVWECGSSVNECMHYESDAMILTRVAMGEVPNVPNDQIFVMWNIKLRAALGFKNAGYNSGWRKIEGQWGPETSIAEEALCNGGCQYEPVRAANNIYYPCRLGEGHQLRKMLCPTDNDRYDFYMAYQAAQKVVEAHITDMPEELRGYDGFRAPSVTWYGQVNREGGLVSRQFFPRGEIWRDEYEPDNVFWEMVEAGIPTATPLPTATPTATATPTPTATKRNLQEGTGLMYSDEQQVSAIEQHKEDVPMKGRTWLRFALPLVLLFVWLAISAFQSELPTRVDEIIAGAIALAIILVGPKPLKNFYDVLNIPGGAWRVIALYVTSGVVGLLALLAAGAITGIPTDAESILALAGILATAASAAYHRLKDLGEI
jgi:hypothetical protein